MRLAVFIKVFFGLKRKDHMLNPQVESILKRLEALLRDGTATPARFVMEGTFVCFTEQVPGGGVVYHQQPFEALPNDIQLVFRNRRRGERIAHIKIVGVFDIWMPECIDYTPASKPVEI